MEKLRLNIDGKEVYAVPGQTILEVARENDIFIPTLCFDERTKIYGSCGMCMTEIEGNPKLWKACATEVADGMVITTDSERIRESRKTNLELLLSNHKGDCRPPCALTCPAGTDCQGYVGLIANGEFEEALKLIKDKIPLPASVGRVCPHPCEKECRRGLVDEPINIVALKRFAADMDLADVPWEPEMDEETGKSVAIIGGGPMGLSAASFLRQMGHSVTVFEAMPKAGGMLRYGIPEYRLPKAVLDTEISLIEDMGVEIITNAKIGEDISFETVRKEHDAVLIGIGAWLSTGTRAPGEDAEGIIGGIDFLRRVVRNEPIDFGKKVAIVGGGNTAMDACRTAVRLGAEKVYNIYRRTKDEMPADIVEIEEAEEEGVVFKNLTNPAEFIKDDDGHVKQVKLQVMELGEADASGRRKPVPVEGKFETLDVDTVILAIGQAVDSSMFEGVDKTRKNGIVYDPETYMTAIPGVFAGGDCGNDKISIAIEAIADAKKAALIIDAYLHGEEIKYEKPYVVTRDDITEKTFEDRERQCRPEIPQLSAEERKDNFTEVVGRGFTQEDAVKEASRCLECGCHDYYECKLIDFANQYDVEPERFAGDKNEIEYEDDHPFIVRDPNKCILCGLCVRVCDEVMGIGALGLVHRGFDTVVKPNMEKPLVESGCISCGQCVSVCPCGALQERLSIPKEVPLETEEVTTTCSYCSVGCSLKLESCGDMLIKANPDKEGPVNEGISCGKGKWGFDSSLLEGKLVEPLVKSGNDFREADYHEALVLIAKKMEMAGIKYGKDSMAVAVSDRFTNEEAYVMKKLAQKMGAKVFSFNNRKSGIAPVLGHDASPNTINELVATDVIVAVGFNRVDNPVIWIKMKQAAENGAKVYLINPEGYEQDMSFAKCIYTGNDITDIKGFAKACVDIKGEIKAEGSEEFVKSLAGVVYGDDIKEAAEAYVNAKKAMIVFQQNLVSVETATLIADTALATGHIGSPRDGILQVKAKNNSQGLIDLGIKDGAEAMDGVKALLVFGEDPKDLDVTGLDFLAVVDTHMTDLAFKADVVIPGTGFASTEGTYTNTERRLQPVVKAIDEDVLLSNWEVADELANIFEEADGYENVWDIAVEMEDNLAKYKYAELYEVFGGVLKPVDAKLIPVGEGKFADPLACTDNLMNDIAARIPEPAK